MPEDVLEKLSTVIGRKVTATPAPSKRPVDPERQASEQSFARNKAWSKSGSYTTTLPAAQENEFQQWAKANPDLVQGEINNPTADYDVRGRWLAEKNGDPSAKLTRSKFDGKLHASDKWKTPYHRTFSSQSIYATQDAPQWHGTKLIDKTGNVIIDETPSGKAQVKPEPDWDADDYRAHGLPVPTTATKSLEQVLGRPIQATTLSPMAQQRLRIYGQAKKNGFDAHGAAQAAVNAAGVVSATPPKSAWQKTKDAVGNIPVSPGSKRTLGDVESDIGEIAHRVWANPMAVSDEQWEKDRKAMDAFVTEIDERHLGKGKVAQFFTGVDRGGLQFAGEQMAPGQIALLIGTFGESALVRAASKIGVAGAVPIARTLSKLMQAQFAAQMVEGAATGAENTVKSAMDGDWGAAGQAAIGGLVSGLMVKGLITHEAANSQVRGDLERTARERYGVPQGNPVQAAISSRFDQLDVHQQAAVIDATVRNSPQYQDVMKDGDEKTKKHNERRLNDYYSTAMSQSWDENVAKRTIKKLQTGRERGAAIDAKQADQRARDQKIGEWLQGAREEYEKQRAEARSARPQRKQDEAAERSQVGRVAESIAQKRDEVWQQRTAAQDAEVVAEAPKRELETATDAQGNVMYPATYWGEQNHFGAVADTSGHAIYRQTERGTEWLDANGKFTDSPEALYMTPDPATADTIARISAINAEADSIAAQEGATPEQIADAEKVAAIHREVIAGEITAREAQARAGISEKVTLPGEFEAARDGRLNGPFHESSAAEYVRGLEEEARSVGASEEDIAAILDEAGLLARQSTENNLHHVYRPGDYITGKNGVKWTLDGKGMLHPDDGGQAVPLMRRGLYSNDAMQLAQSGRVGYGLKTREQRRADRARQRAAMSDIAANQAAIDHEMRVAIQRQGLEPALQADPRADAEAKAMREQRRMSRPPRPESPVDAVVRMAFQKPTDPNSIINSIANRRGVSPEEVMRLALANDPERSTTTEAQIARLEPEDSISDSFRKDKPWKVELRKDGSLALRSGNASPIPLDRLNPSDRVKQLVEKGTVTTEKPEFTEDDARRAAFDKPHYMRHQEELVQQVVDRKEGKAKDPIPRTPKQAEAQVKAAERRAVAAEAVATRAVVEAVNPTTESVEQAEGKVEDAEQQIAVAEEAVAQHVEVESRTEPEGDFPQRAPASIGYRAPTPGTIKQNGRFFSFHYELLPLDAVITSHQWINGRMEINPDFPEALQPRTVSSDESKLNALRAERRVETPDGRSSGYDFSEYADMTINGSMGPAIVDQGGQTVGGNTRIAIMRRHLENLASIVDPEEREAYQMGMRAAMRKLAEDVGIPGYPEGDIPHVVVRMLDEPIKDSRKAAELGRLFNKKVGVQIGEAARGVSFAKSLDDSVLQDIGRRVEANDGIAGAIAADPEFFTNIVRNRFDVDETEDADWFRKTDQGTKVLHEKGRDQFTKALLGTVVKDTSVLNRLEGKTPYRALERALGYIVKMKALPDRDLTPKIMEALQAAAETANTDPALSRSNDKWLATYHPDQLDLIASESTTPPEPDRVVETLWRALHASDAATPRVFNDRLKAFLGEDSSLAGNMFEVTRPSMAEAFNDAFSKQLGEVQFSRQDKTKGITDEEFEHSLRNQEMSDTERAESNSEEEGDRGESPEQQAGSGLASIPASEPPLSTAISKLSRNQQVAIKKQIDGKKLTTKDREVMDDLIQNHWDELPLEFFKPDVRKKIGYYREHPGLEEAMAGKSGIDAALSGMRQIKKDLGVFQSPHTAHMRSEPEIDEMVGKLTADEVRDWTAKEYIQATDRASLATALKASRRNVASFSAALNSGAEWRDVGLASIQARQMIDERVGPLDTGKMERPPKAEPKAERVLAAAKAEKGYVTPSELKSFLEGHPGTKDSVPELMRTSRIMAEFVFDADQPVGVDRKDALAWILKERLAGVQDGSLKTKRGEYSDPNIEKGFGDRIMKLHKAADASSFIHEFAHVIFPMLSDQDLQLIDTIRGEGEKGEAGRVWDRKTRLEGDPYRKLSEKFAHGLEQFLRDENPTGFTTEVKAVLAKVKDMMQRIYAKFAGDPLSPFANTEESRDVFSRMFGITDFDAQDRWSKEKAKLRAEEARMKKPSETLHPIVQMAKNAGAKSLKSAVAGKVEDSIGARVDPRKPMAVMIFDNEAKATEFAVEIASGAAKIDGAELIQGDDGTWGVRFNTKAKLTPDALYQDIPKTELASDLERAKKALSDTPESATMLRKMRQQRVQILENQIREQYGAETEPVEASVAKQALQEAKNGATDGLRKGTDGVPRILDAPKFTSVPKPPTLGKLSRDAGAGSRGVGSTGKPEAGPRSLAEVKAITLQPIARERGPAVGTVVGEAFDSKAWVASLKTAGLPETAPAPTWALDRKTADMLKFPGQKQVVQIALSALEHGDGAVVATSTGTGKSYSSSAVIKEWRMRHPEAKVLYITKNTGLLKSTGSVMESTFGYDMESDIPDAPEAGVYGATYAKLLSNQNLKNIKWDLVIADESGEARNYFRDENKQGKALVELTENAGKAVWFSATPFHSPAEYGYLNKLNLWPKNGFDKWIEGNFAHEKVDGKVIAKLDPAKQAKLRQQLIERGQLVSQAVSYDGFTAQFGVVPVTDQMNRDLDRTREGFARARKYLMDKGKKGLAEKSAALEATYTKALLERARIPQAIELAKRAQANGWKVLFFSETSSEDLFRRDTDDPGTYQQLDEAMGGQLSKIIPAFPNVFEKLQAEFGDQIGDYSGRGNSMAERERAKSDFLSGKTPHLYTTYAAGGIGVSLHDADYPDRGIKGGDKPRVAIFLGPPYSGVALEQAMGRTWRFGVKSDTHAVFLATDSEPDVRLMQQKVGPRMRALRASVLGERDSLASAMANYTDEEKVKARQEALAYAEAGDEVKVNAASFGVRSAKRNVGINDWSLINFPTADSAKNKGMKYGEDVPGGDWSNLYQNKFAFMEAPPSEAEKVANDVIDAIGAGVSSGDGLPKGVSVQDMEPADRDTVMGAASASASEAVQQPVDRDKAAAARQTVQAHLALPGDKTKWILTFPKGKGKGVWRYTGDPEDIARSKPTEGGERQKNIRTHYYGAYFSQEVGINSIARQAGAREAGEEIVRINRSYQADSDVKFADFALDAQKIMNDNKLDVDDPRTMSELWDTVKGTRTTTNPAIQRAADALADLHDRVHGEEAAADVKLKTPNGNVISWKEITKDRNYMPQRIDWDAQVEDPVTGETHKLRDLMGETIPEEKRRRIVEAISRDKGYSYDQVMNYLKAYQPNTPVLGHINRARTLDFPFIKKDWKTLIGYYRQAADAIAIEKNFGHDRAKLDREISKIPSNNGRKTITSMFDAMLQPQEWEDWTAKAYNAAIAYESASKLTMSATKVIFHAVHFPVGLKGRVAPVARAAFNLIAHPKEVFENAAYVGTIARQLNVADVLAAEDSQGVTHQIFSKTGFNSAYKLVRAWSGESARVWMEQYAMHDLLKYKKMGEGTIKTASGTTTVSFPAYAETRRLLHDVMLMSDQAIDRAIEQEKFAPEDLAKGQTAFANLTAWSNNPLQMPGWARLHMEKESATTAIALSRAVRLTYALQSFSLKTASFLRENLWDEVMIHGNYKPLAYAMVAAPIVGQMLQASSAGARGFTHRGLEGITGHKHDHDAWDKWLEDQEHTFHDPTAAKFLKYYIDSVTLGYGLDMARMVMNPLLNSLTGNHKLSVKEARYVGQDVAMHVAGPAYSDLYKTIVEFPTKMFEIEEAAQSEEVKAKKAVKATKNYLMDEIPILRQVPGFADPPKRSN